MTIVKIFRRLLSTSGKTLSFIIRQYQQTQKLKSWQTEKYINNEYISLTHGVEEHWVQVWVYCMLWVFLFLKWMPGQQRQETCCEYTCQLSVVFHQTLEFDIGWLLSKCWSKIWILWAIYVKNGPMLPTGQRSVSQVVMSCHVISCRPG